MADWERPLTDAERTLIEAAREKAFLLYEGRVTPHRSCGIALAETFGLPSRPYQALRRGGITGAGLCGVIQGGRLILGELLGDPDPTGPVTPELRAAAMQFDARFPSLLDRGGTVDTGQSCNELTARFPTFQHPDRATHCTRLAADVAGLVAELVLRSGGSIEIIPIAETP